MPRFADQELQKLNEEFLALHSQFVVLKDEFEEHRMETQRLHNELLQALRDNTNSTTETSKLLTQLTVRTEGVIAAWEASQGALTILGWAGSAIKWVAGVLVSAGAVWYWITHR